MSILEDPAFVLFVAGLRKVLVEVSAGELLQFVQRRGTLLHVLPEFYAPFRFELETPALVIWRDHSRLFGINHLHSRSFQILSRSHHALLVQWRQVF